MKDFFLPGDTFAPRIPCGFSSLLYDARRQFSAPGGEPTDWQTFGGAERRRVEFYEGRFFITSQFMREGHLYREDSGPRWYAGPLWCRAGGRQYRITYDETERQFYAERILPTSPHRECITYELGDRPPCAPLCA
jgi:hypothetical protein